MGRNAWVLGASLAMLAGLSTVAGCSESEEPVGRSVEAIWGGRLATEPIYDAVACGPRGGIQPVGISGWDATREECEMNTTFITPNIALVTPHRILGQDGQWEFGHQTVRPFPPEDVISGVTTAFEVGTGLRPMQEPGPEIHRYGVMLYEQRTTRIASYCPHPWVVDDDSIDADAGRHYWRPVSTAEWGDLMPPRYPPGDHRRSSQVDDCESRTLPSTCTPSYCEWAETRLGSGVFVCRAPRHDAGGEYFDRYSEYVAKCADPLEPDEVPLGAHAFFIISERVDEALLTPLPISFTYPDGTTNPAYLNDPDLYGDAVGYGGIYSGGGYSIRRIAPGSTRIIPQSDFPAALSPDLTFFEDSTRFVRRRGDPSDRGPGHVDYGAPVIYGDPRDGTQHVLALHYGGTGVDIGQPFSALLTDQTIRGLRDFLDPDQDGILRGFVDAYDPTTRAPRVGYIDNDGDGFSEYRIVDGELVETGGDNCPPPLDSPWVSQYRNIDQRDRDGDGVGDACDLCPANWDREQAYCLARRDFTATESPSGRPVARGEPIGRLCADYADGTESDNDDLDGDGFNDYFCDNCPGIPNPALPGDAFQSDRDEDGIGDECDLCPDIPNPEQDPTDADGDGVPDACDNCPPSRCANPLDCANGDQADDDADRVGNACDNCVSHSNPDQLNCNEEAERVLASRLPAGAVEVLGDACDPVPCAQTQIGLNRSVDGPLREVTYTMDRMELDARLGTPDPASPPDSLNARTSFRWCRCALANDDTLATRQACLSATLNGAGELVEGGCSLLDLLEHDEVAEGTPWRRTHMFDPYEPRRTCTADGDCRANEECSTGQCRCTSLLPGDCPWVDGYDPPTGGFLSDRVASWRVREDDVPRWITGGLVPSGEVFPPDQPLRGVLWTHTPGPEGRPNFDLLPEYGLEHRQLASHYWSGRQLPPRTARPPLPCYFPVAPFVGGSEICPFCEAHIPQPWLAFRGTGGCGSARFEFPFVVLGPDPLEPLPELPLTGLDLFVDDPGPWLAVAETGQWLEDGQGLRYAKVDEGLSVTRTLFELEGAFVEQSACPQCDPVPPPSTTTGTGTEPAPAAPEPIAREGHAAVLSARRQAMWVVGGQANPGGGELRDLWRYDLGTQHWHRLPTTVLLGHILAATYSPIEDRVYILDEVTSGSQRGRSSGREIRIVSVHAEGGLGVVEASWPRRSRNGAFAMSFDPGGALWVAGWPTSGRVHAVLRLARGEGGSLLVRGWDLGSGRLVGGQIRAGDRGLSAVAQVNPSRSPEVVHHTTVDLREGPGGERACF